MRILEGIFIFLSASNFFSFCSCAEPKIGDNTAEERRKNAQKLGGIVENQKILDEGVLEASNAFEISLDKSLALHWGNWIKNGIQQEWIEKLLKNYVRTPEFEAPNLNMEITSILSESAVERDRFLANNQQLTGSALMAIGSALTMVIQEEELDKYTLMERLSHASNLVTQIHYNQTASRKALIYPVLRSEEHTSELQSHA